MEIFHVFVVEHVLQPWSASLSSTLAKYLVCTNEKLPDNYIQHPLELIVLYTMASSILRIQYNNVQVESVTGIFDSACIPVLNQHTYIPFALQFSWRPSGSVQSPSHDSYTTSFFFGCCRRYWHIISASFKHRRGPKWCATSMYLVYTTSLGSTALAFVILGRSESFGPCVRWRHVIEGGGVLPVERMGEVGFTK